MSRNTPLDYGVVRQFLKGDLDLVEVVALRTISHATRALIAQAIVLAQPEAFLAAPMKDLVLSCGIADLYRDIFGRDQYASVMSASHAKGLHTTGIGKESSRVTLVIPLELRTLVEHHKDSEALAEAARHAIGEQWDRKRRNKQPSEGLQARARKIVNTADFLENTLDEGDLIYLTWLIRQRFARKGLDTFSDPSQSWGSHELEAMLKRMDYEKTNPS